MLIWEVIDCTARQSDRLRRHGFKGCACLNEEKLGPKLHLAFATPRRTAFEKTKQVFNASQALELHKDLP